AIRPGSLPTSGDDHGRGNAAIERRALPSGAGSGSSRAPKAGGAMRVPRPSKEASPREGRMDFHSGMMIANRYRVEHRVGSGGMGAVWVGVHLRIGIRVRLKKLLPVCHRGKRTTARLLCADEDYRTG